MNTKVIFDNGTHKIEVAADAVINPTNYLTQISTQAFFRRLTKQERAALRGTTNSVRDLKEDVERGDVVELDEPLRQAIADSGLFTQERIEELLLKGESHEGRLR